jgi:hypothetical protein
MKADWNVFRGPGQGSEEKPLTKTIIYLLILSLGLTSQGCRPSAKSQRSFDQIRELVQDRTASEVEKILGKPDMQEAVLDEQRWVWWNYTFLDGDQYAPEVRGQVVHLEILFRSSSSSAGLRVAGPLAVSYSRPATNP